METLQLREVFDTLQANTALHPYIEVSHRRAYLCALKEALRQNADAIIDAICQDFSWRSSNETALLELFPTIKAIEYCHKNLKKWSKPRRRKVTWMFYPSGAKIFPQPLGVVGNLVPWNYPLYLSLVPAIYAIAAGNRVMIKMSERSQALGVCLARIVESLPKTHFCDIQVVNGDIACSQAFAKLPFDHLVFTGSTTVGKHVMAAASPNLTPVTLELGGKSPTIISTSAKARHYSRVVIGKCLNAGQTCIAPDYILIEKEQEDVFVATIIKQFKKLYPNAALGSDFSSIISDDHYARLKAMLDDAEKKGARVQRLGTFDDDKRKFPLCIVQDLNPDMLLMQEEIFGPILPVVRVDDFSSAIDRIRQGQHPLALYYFGSNAKEIARIEKEILSGALTINDTLTHIAIDDLPFGGVGASGMGHYHGIEGFNTFSKLKPIYTQANVSSFEMMHPPYGQLLRFFLKAFGGIRFKK